MRCRTGWKPLENGFGKGCLLTLCFLFLQRVHAVRVRLRGLSPMAGGLDCLDDFGLFTGAYMVDMRVSDSKIHHSSVNMSQYPGVVDRRCLGCDVGKDG